jgi:hypothetical protein
MAFWQAAVVLILGLAVLPVLPSLQAGDREGEAGVASEAVRPEQRDGDRERPPFMGLARRGFAAGAVPVARTADEAAARRAETLRKKLAETTLSVEFADAPLADVLAFLSKSSGINMVVDAVALRKLGIATDQTKVTLALTDVPVSTVLRAALELQVAHELGFIVMDGYVLITTRERIAEKAGQPASGWLWPGGMMGEMAGGGRLGPIAEALDRARRARAELEEELAGKLAEMDRKREEWKEKAQTEGAQALEEQLARLEREIGELRVRLRRMREDGEMGAAYSSITITGDEGLTIVYEGTEKGGTMVATRGDKVIWKRELNGLVREVSTRDGELTILLADGTGLVLDMATGQQR